MKPGIRIGMLLLGMGLAAAHGQTIHNAVMKGQLDSVRVFLSADASLLDAGTAEGETPLHLAAYTGQCPVTQYLLEQGANVESRTGYGYTPLHYAAFGGSTDAAALLIKYHADINCRHIEGSTPLQLAAQQGKAGMVQILLEQGADINAADFYGYTALDLAADFNQAETMALLKSRDGRLTPIPDADVKTFTQGLYRLDFPWGQSTNMLAQAGPDGWLLVDSGFSRRANPKILETLSALADGSIHWIINTHAHWDHTAGNALMTDRSHVVTLADLDSLAGAGVLTVRAADSPLFQRIYQFSVNGTTIHMIPFPGVHTQADMMVYFPEFGVVHMGDLLIAQSFPSVTRKVDAYMDFLKEVMAYFPEETVFVCGHGRECRRGDVQAYHAMLQKSAAVIREAVRKGNTLQQIHEQGLLRPFAPWENFIPVLNADYWFNAVMNTDRDAASQ